jgi:hypothetical protein
MDSTSVSLLESGCVPFVPSSFFRLSFKLPWFGSKPVCDRLSQSI